MSQIGLGAQDSFAVTDTLGIKTYWERINDTGTLGLTAEIRRELLDSEDQIELNQNFNVSRTALSASVQYALFSLRERLLITPTLQWQSVSDHYNGVSSRNKNYRKDSVLSPQIGFRFEFNNDLSLRANIGRYHRQAAFYELFGSRGLVTGNTNLEPEKGINSDIGFSYKANTNWSIDANVFASTRTQLITTVYDRLVIGHTINAGKAQIMGVEVTSQWQLNPQLSARLNLTVQDTQSVSNSTSTDGKQLPGKPNITCMRSCNTNMRHGEHGSNSTLKPGFLRPGQLTCRRGLLVTTRRSGVVFENIQDQFFNQEHQQ